MLSRPCRVSKGSEYVSVPHDHLRLHIHSIHDFDLILRSKSRLCFVTTTRRDAGDEDSSFLCFGRMHEACRSHRPCGGCDEACFFP
jgi:hypothetical protein